MKSHEVLRQAVDEPGVKSVAAQLKVSAALVYKWGTPPPTEADPDQSGTKNPLDRVAELYHITRDIRLVRWLCNEADGFFVANPQPELDRSTDEAIYVQTRGMFRDFANLLDAITTSVEDDQQVDAHEADIIRQKWEDLKATLERFVLACEQGHYHLQEQG